MLVADIETGNGNAGDNVSANASDAIAGVDGGGVDGGGVDGDGEGDGADGADASGGSDGKRKRKRRRRAPGKGEETRQTAEDVEGEEEGDGGEGQESGAGEKGVDGSGGGGEGGAGGVVAAMDGVVHTNAASEGADSISGGEKARARKRGRTGAHNNSDAAEDDAEDRPDAGVSGNAGLRRGSRVKRSIAYLGDSAGDDDDKVRCF